MTALVQTHRAPATAVARPVAAEPAQYLTFMLAGEMFAIGILAIKEIIEYHSLTEVPMMPDCVRGVINLRGAVVPVMDLLARFGRPPSPVTKRTCIVIVEVESEGERQVIGVVVDAVNEVLDIDLADIEPAPAFGARIRTDFIHGMGKVRGKFVILLNVDHVLSLDDLGTLAEATDRPHNALAV
ncbi:MULTISPECIES: chemotaxis protein CheW [unclassified Rhizobacter]|uniref:chemotaxis protein CheW n=1 Tax=unclassified Rhizobacter TaxID=2640088 RepID=UPI0006F364BC|nr:MULTISPECIES: chemotaxis protein CheW [unclassified Rhizobacter]KQU71623.1 chemotaxis protein CheW [Rhizobacter sp. Root29]KQW15387.1 chemotaxis protein CheW [Rhizobacter sp. Root1238]KRB12423.1 chemotaxis protein CheW [Rhizobacter sp. Root16D2]